MKERRCIERNYRYNIRATLSRSYFTLRNSSKFQFLNSHLVAFIERQSNEENNGKEKHENTSVKRH